MESEGIKVMKELCYCPKCEKTECIHRDTYRRMPREIGGLGLCPNLKNPNAKTIERGGK